VCAANAGMMIQLSVFVCLLIVIKLELCVFIKVRQVCASRHDDHDPDEYVLSDHCGTFGFVVVKDYVTIGVGGVDSPDFEVCGVWCVVCCVCVCV